MHAVRSTRPAIPSSQRGTKRPDRQERTESTAQLDPLIGVSIGDRYLIQELIGSGGMGRVYRAVQEPLGRQVALKIVRDQPDLDDEDLRAERRLRMEATILAQLSHPNIVALHDFGVIEGPFHGRSFMVMELLDGRSLADELQLDRRIAPTRVATIAGHVLRALRFAHRQGIVHRDLKPSNVLLVRDADGEEIVKLVDFGIGKQLSRGGDPTRLTRTGAVLGTVGYIAPEQIQNRTSPASDLFALGVVMFEALVGKPPFDPGSAMSAEGFAAPAPRLGDVAPDLVLPLGLASLVADLLDRDPEARPTASEALARLAKNAEGFAAPTTAPHSVLRERSVGVARDATEPAPAPRNAPWLGRASVLAIVIYALVLTVMFSRSGTVRGGEPGAHGPDAASAPRTGDATRAPATDVAPPASPARAPAAARTLAPRAAAPKAPRSGAGPAAPEPTVALPAPAPAPTPASTPRRTVFSTVSTEDE